MIELQLLRMADLYQSLVEGQFRSNGIRYGLSTFRLA